jgi:hypothetical protein
MRADRERWRRFGACQPDWRGVGGAGLGKRYGQTWRVCPRGTLEGWEAGFYSGGCGRFLVGVRLGRRVRAELAAVVP